MVSVVLLFFIIYLQKLINHFKDYELRRLFKILDVKSTQRKQINQVRQLQIIHSERLVCDVLFITNS